MAIAQSRGIDLDLQKTKQDKRRENKREKKRGKEREKKKEKEREKETKKKKERREKKKRRRDNEEAEQGKEGEFPLRRVPRCPKCFRKAQRAIVSASNARNPRRPYYTCLYCTGTLAVDGTRTGANFITFDDNIGVRREHCGVADSGSTGAGRKYLQCPIGTCGYFRWMDSIVMEWDGVEDVDTQSMELDRADSPCSIRRAFSDEDNRISINSDGIKVENGEEVTCRPLIEVHTTWSEPGKATLNTEPKSTILPTVLQRSLKRRKIECDDGHALRVKAEVSQEDAVALAAPPAIKQEQDVEQETALASAHFQPYHRRPSSLQPQTHRGAITNQGPAPALPRFGTPIIKQEFTPPPASTNRPNQVKAAPDHAAHPSLHRSRKTSPCPANPPLVPSAPQTSSSLSTQRPAIPTAIQAIQHLMHEARKLAQVAVINARKARNEHDPQPLDAHKPQNNQPQPHSLQHFHRQNRDHDDADQFIFPTVAPAQLAHSSAYSNPASASGTKTRNYGAHVYETEQSIKSYMDVSAEAWCRGSSFQPLIPV